MRFVERLLTQARIAALLLAGLSVVPVEVFAQGHDIIGAWALVKQESLSGQDYADGLPKEMRVEQGKGSITIERVLTTPNGDFRYSETLIAGGVAAERVTPGRRKGRSTAKWPADLATFEEEGRYSAPDDEHRPDHTVTESWQVSNAGKTLTILITTKYVADRDKDWSMRGIYARQPQPAMSGGKGK